MPFIFNFLIMVIGIIFWNYINAMAWIANC